MRKLYESLLIAMSIVIVIAGIGYSSASANVVQLSGRATTGSVITPIHRTVRRVISVLSRSKRVVYVLRSYTVRPGDTLSSIASRVYGNAGLWPALWWVNKAHIRNPNEIYAGETLKLSSWHPETAWLLRSATGTNAPTRTAPQRAVTTASVSSGGYAVASSFQACVIARESGGSTQVMNSSGHYGLYQFSYDTWVAAGGSGADFGHASAAEQTRIFWNAYREWGTSPWAPYDGC